MAVGTGALPPEKFCVLVTASAVPLSLSVLLDGSGRLPARAGDGASVHPIADTHPSTTNERDERFAVRLNMPSPWL
jgi:hypothetical protein